MSEEKKIAPSETKVLVTGATGFVASHIVEQLLDKGYSVRGTVRSLANPDKNAHLTSMNGADERLELVEANLLDDGAFDAAVQGCDYVMHTASPYSIDVSDPQKDLVDPAVKGTVSVLESVKKADSVKRVVLTSSVAAILDEPISDHTFTEADWNDKSTLKRNPYYYSKTVAERSAWEFAKENDIDLVVINPFVVLGRAHTKSVNPSNHIIHALFNGEYPAKMALDWGMVDVVDVAKAHILAMEVPGANGRNICCARTITMAEMVDKLKTMYPNAKKLPTKSLDGCVGTGLVKLGSYFQPGQVGQYLRTHLGRHLLVDNSKIKADLGFEFTDFDETIRATVEDALKWGHIKDDPRE